MLVSPDRWTRLPILCHAGLSVVVWASSYFACSAWDWASLPWAKVHVSASSRWPTSFTTTSMRWIAPAAVFSCLPSALLTWSLQLLPNTYCPPAQHQLSRLGNDVTHKKWWCTSLWEWNVFMEPWAQLTWQLHMRTTLKQFHEQICCHENTWPSFHEHLLVPWTCSVIIHMLHSHEAIQIAMNNLVWAHISKNNFQSGINENFTPPIVQLTSEWQLIVITKAPLIQKILWIAKPLLIFLQHLWWVVAPRK